MKRPAIYGLGSAVLGVVFALSLFMSTMMSASMNSNIAPSQAINIASKINAVTDISCPDCLSAAMQQVQDDLECVGCASGKMPSGQCGSICTFAAAVAVLSMPDFQLSSVMSPSYEGLGIAVSSRSSTVDPAPPKFI